jgi:hypothetical protein
MNGLPSISHVIIQRPNSPNQNHSTWISVFPCKDSIIPKHIIQQHPAGTASTEPSPPCRLSLDLWIFKPVFQSSDEMLATTGPQGDRRATQFPTLCAATNPGEITYFILLHCNCTKTGDLHRTSHFSLLIILAYGKSTSSSFTTTQRQASILGQTRIEYLSEIEFRDAV